MIKRSYIKDGNISVPDNPDWDLSKYLEQEKIIKGVDEGLGRIAPPTPGPVGPAGEQKKPVCRYCGEKLGSVPRHPDDPRGQAYFPTCICHQPIKVGDLRELLNIMTNGGDDPNSWYGEPIDGGIENDD